MSEAWWLQARYEYCGLNILRAVRRSLQGVGVANFIDAEIQGPKGSCRHYCSEICWSVLPRSGHGTSVFSY